MALDGGGGARCPQGALSRSDDHFLRPTAQLAAAHGWRQILLVSSGYHLARAEAVFQKAGLDVMPAGAEFLGLDGLDGLDGKGSWRVVPRSRGFDLIGYWAHEQVGWLFYRWKGWV